MNTKRLRVVCGLAVVAMAMATMASAQIQERRTYFTFNRPITLPGVTLPAGKYLFALVDSDTSTRVVRVSSANGKKSYALLFSIPRERTDVPSSPEVRFMETAKGTPSAVKTWWYPGERTGYEFIYSKRQARLLVREAVEPVLTTRTETVKQEEIIRDAPLQRLTPAGEEAEVTTAPAAPTGVVEVGIVATAELPKTASELPLIGLLGLFALAGAGGLRVFRSARTQVVL
jgi:hypothetical protein